MANNDERILKLFLKKETEAALEFARRDRFSKAIRNFEKRGNFRYGNH